MITHLRLDNNFVLISCYHNFINFRDASFTTKRAGAIQTVYMAYIEPDGFQFCLYRSKSFPFSFILFKVRMNTWVWLLLLLWWMAIAIISACCWGIWQKCKWKNQALEGWNDWISSSSLENWKHALESDFASIFIHLHRCTHTLTSPLKL